MSVFPIPVRGGVSRYSSRVVITLFHQVVLSSDPSNSGEQINR